MAVKDQNPTVYSAPDQEEESLKDVFLAIQKWVRYLWKQWRIIVIVGLLGGVIGLVVSLVSKPTYIAKASFAVEGASGVSSLGGLASMVGINLGASSGDGLFSTASLLELYKSRIMISQTLLDPIDSTSKELLIDRFITMNDLRNGWEDTEYAHVKFHKTPAQFTRVQDSILKGISTQISENLLQVQQPDETVPIIGITVSSKNELFSKAFTDNLVKNVNSFYRETQTKKADNNVKVLQHQVDSVRKVLNAAIHKISTAAGTGINANPALGGLRADVMQTQVDVQANTAILEALVKNLEIAKVSLRKKTPLIQPIDLPLLPLEVEEIGIIKGVVLGGFIAGVLVLLFLFGKEYYREVMAEES